LVFILGGSIAKVVTSFVNDNINPVVGIIFGATRDLEDNYLPIGGTKIMWGIFLSTSIDFIIIAFVVYFGLKILRLVKLDIKKTP
jgi:large conductance mechanosensitive channel